MSRYLLFVFASICALFAGGTWFAFLRPAEVKVASGIIRSKIHKPAGEYVQYPSGSNRDSFYGPNRIPIAECYILVIHVDALSADVGYAANIPESQNYEVGQHVTLHYLVRGIPGIWRRVYVTSLAPS
ncbi:MAG TPA: hypothetical protein VHZ52_17395 [Acidobacteriaceae bacterium]|jgi:hypothetical protein|nr:hypothetical protein [Acidobacteriaceae bacterium]